MMSRVQPLLDAFNQAVTTPTANPVLTIVVLAGILLAIIMIGLTLMLMLTPSHRESVTIRRYRRVRRDVSDPQDVHTEDGDAAIAVSGTVSGSMSQPGDDTPMEEAASPDVVPQAPAAPRRISARRLSGTATALLLCVLAVAVAVASAYVITGTDAYCIEQCHGGSQAVKHASDVDHASCVSCHEEPGFSGVVPNIVSRVRMGTRALSSPARPTDGATVSSAACLACHKDILGETVSRARGIAMSHKEPVAAGVACTECHTQTGHSKRSDFSMSSCIACHGSSDELNRCSLCHLSDPYDVRARGGSAESSETIGDGRIIYPLVDIAETDCGGCHDQAVSCDPCHGTRVPHSRQFIEGGHAPTAAFERKKMCEKCHEPLWCARSCHLVFEDGHGPTWRTTHMNTGPDSVCGCHAIRSGRTTPMCLLCHPKR